MSGFFLPPTFTPTVPPIHLGTAGQVLTMVNGVPAFTAAAGGGPATLGARLAYASPAGGAVAANPAIVATTGRLLVTLAAGSATWVSLTAGTVDGQLLLIVNNDGANTLTLPAADFPGFGDLIVPPGGRVLTYWDSTNTLWNRTGP